MVSIPPVNNILVKAIIMDRSATECTYMYIDKKVKVIKLYHAVLQYQN